MKHWLVVWGALILFSGSVQMPSDSFVADPTITLIPFPTTGMAGEPFLTRSPEGVVYASWLERRDDQAFFLFSRLTGDSWSPPVQIASGSNWFINWADVPTLTAASGGRLMATWLERLGEGRYAYGVRFAVSGNGGASWSAPEWLHADRSQSEHGFVSAAPVSGGFLAVWLDGNGYATERKAMAIHSRIVRFDGSLEQEKVVDARTCDCCPTAISPTDDGRLLTLYRGRTGQEIRDISASYWDGSAWSNPVSVHEDGWKIEACPVNGPAVHARDGQMVTSWFTAAGGQPTLNARVSKDGEATATNDPVRLDLGHPVGRVAARMRTASEAAILWIEGSGSETNGLLLRTLTSGGQLSDPFQVSPISEGRSSGYPRLEVDGDQLIAMWTAATDPPTIKSARITW